MPQSSNRYQPIDLVSPQIQSNQIALQELAGYYVQTTPSSFNGANNTGTSSGSSGGLLKQGVQHHHHHHHTNHHHHQQQGSNQAQLNEHFNSAQILSLLSTTSNKLPSIPNQQTPTSNSSSQLTQLMRGCFESAAATTTSNQQQQQQQTLAAYYSLIANAAAAGMTNHHASGDLKSGK